MGPMAPVIPIYQVDAFTDRPFGGNPAAVCLLDEAAPEEWMANVAAEMNLAETAFCWPEDDRFRLRWFTPAVEVALCGHATLATAHVVWRERGVSDVTPLRFATASGELRASRVGERISLDLPAETAIQADPAVVSATAEALGVEVLGAADYGANLLVELDGPAALRALTPDIAAVAALPYQGVIVTGTGDTADYLIRYFAPAVGVPEDPVTGSAQCAAGPWWRTRTGRTTFEVEQASPRSGRMWVEVGDQRVSVAGHALTVFRGELVVAGA